MGDSQAVMMMMCDVSSVKILEWRKTLQTQGNEKAI